MAEYRVPTQAELDRLLYMQGLSGKTNQQIIDENLARGTTIQSLPESLFTTASAGARRVGDYVNQAGNAQQIINKLFPSQLGNTQANVRIPTGFNFAPKQMGSGEVLPQGLQTQSVPVASILQAIKPADVLGISGAERAYGDIGAGKAPQPLDVVDTLGVGAVGLGATSGLLKATKGLPVGLGIQEAKGLLQTAPKSDIGFYSAVEQAAMATPRKSGAGQAFLNDIIKGQDVRADEIKWMGLDDYLKGKQNVTKQEVQDYIANNRVNVQEVRSTIPRLPGEEMAGDQGEFLPKYAGYQLPGGENYRELLLTLPQDARNVQKKLDDLDKEIYRLEVAKDPRWRELSKERGQLLLDQVKGMYKSSHYPQPNILAHLRVNDRIDADGKKMLLIEEVQSDWHQAGREQGYATKNNTNKQAENDFEDFRQELRNMYGGDPELPNIQSQLAPSDFATYQELRRLAPISNGGKVPDAPFKDTWYQLALKRAIQHAAENGYDRIGLTTGSQQAARYDLSKQIGVLSAEKNPNGTFNIKGFKDEGQQERGRRAPLIEQSNVPAESLSGVIGKDLAKRIIDEGGGNYSGIDLQVGGEGMKKYYDEIYPKFLDKYGKKWGAKVGETTIATGRSNVGGVPSMYPNKKSIRYLDITPEMKAGVSKGQPLFAAVPAIPAAGLLAPQEQQRR